MLLIVLVIKEHAGFALGCYPLGTVILLLRIGFLEKFGQLILLLSFIIPKTETTTLFLGHDL
jgi:hypothetical protein